MEFSSLDTERLERFKSLGFNPKHIFDIGGSNGSWTRSVAKVFPDAHYYLFEPLADENPAYKEGLIRLGESDIKSQVYPLCLGSEPGRTQIGISKNFVGSSVLATQLNDYFPSSKEVDIATLDDFIEDNSFSYPDFIKMDTQGYELEILKGGLNTLKHAQIILLESWVARSYLGKTPLMIEIMLWLADKNFFLLDLAGEYRNDSGLLYSQDLFFVKHPSPIEGLSADRFFDIKRFFELNLSHFLPNHNSLPEQQTCKNLNSRDNVPDAQVLKNTSQEISFGHNILNTKVQRLQNRLETIKRRAKRSQKKLKRVKKKNSNLRVQVKKFKKTKIRLERVEQELKLLQERKSSKFRALRLTLKKKLGLQKP